MIRNDINNQIIDLGLSVLWASKNKNGLKESLIVLSVRNIPIEIMYFLRSRKDVMIEIAKCCLSLFLFAAQKSLFYHTFVTLKRSFAVTYK